MEQRWGDSCAHLHLFLSPDAWGSQQQSTWESPASLVVALQVIEGGVDVDSLSLS